MFIASCKKVWVRKNLRPMYPWLMGLYQHLGLVQENKVVQKLSLCSSSGLVLLWANIICIYVYCLETTVCCHNT